jgi:tetratricopeptide (TPR) repeat protein
VRERHSVYYCRYLQELEGAYKSAQHDEATAAVTVEFENARAAWNWAADHNQVVRLARAVVVAYYCVLGRRPDGAALFRRAVDRCTPDSAPERRAYALMLTGLITFSDVLGMPVQRRKQILHEALAHLAAAATQGEDVRYEEAIALAILGQVLLGDEWREGRAVLERSLSLFTELESEWEMAHLNNYLALSHARVGDYVAAYDYQRQCVQLWKTVGATNQLDRAKMFLAHIEADLGRRDESLATMREVLARFREAGNAYYVAEGEHELARVLTHGGKFAEALALIASAAAYFERLGMSETASDIRISWCHAALHLGQFRDVWDESGRLQVAYREVQADYGVVGATALRGLAALALGRLAEATELLAESVVRSRPMDSAEDLTWSLVTSACAQLLAENVATARFQILEALQLVRTSRDYASWALPAVALLFAKEGQAERALALNLLAGRDPYIANSRWFEVVVGRHVAEVAGKLPHNVADHVRAQAAALDVWQTVEQLARELEERTNVDKLARQTNSNGSS